MKALIFTIFGLYFCFNMNAQAICWSASECAEEAINTLRKLGFKEVFKNEETSAKFCAKGNFDFWNPDFTLRSFQGLICKKSKYWAGWAEFICPNVDGANYNNSKCHEYAKEHFPGMKPSDIFDIIITMKP